MSTASVRGKRWWRFRRQWYLYIPTMSVNALFWVLLWLTKHWLIHTNLRQWTLTLALIVHRSLMQMHAYTMLPQQPSFNTFSRYWSSGDIGFNMLLSCQQPQGKQASFWLSLWFDECLALKREGKILQRIFRDVEYNHWAFIKITFFYFISSIDTTMILILMPNIRVLSSIQALLCGIDGIILLYVRYHEAVTIQHLWTVSGDIPTQLFLDFKKMLFGY